MILKLSKPILDSNKKYVKKLEYDLYNLTIKDFNNVEKIYFNFTMCKEENLIQESHFIYKMCAFFVSCCKINNDLSFVEFLKIKGKDGRRITKIVDDFFIPESFNDKKKD